MKYGDFSVVALLAALAGALQAGDLGPKESTPPGAPAPANSANAPSAPAPIKGPFPSEEAVPGSANTSPSNTDIHAQTTAIDRQIDSVQRKLKSRHLSAQRRAQLKAELADLNAKKLSQPIP